MNLRGLGALRGRILERILCCPSLQQDPASREPLRSLAEQPFRRELVDRVLG